MSDMPERLLAWPSGHNYQRVSLAGGRPNDAVEYVRTNAIPAVQPTVKPLVWRDDGTNGHETDHAFGFYEVYPSPEGDMLSRDGVDSGVFPTLEAAKAAAQADYEARILSALDMQPTVSPELLATTNDVTTLVEALVEISDHHIPDQPAAYGGDEADWARRQHTALRSIAHAALARVKGVM